MTAVQKSGFDAGYASAQYQMWPRTDEAQEKPILRQKESRPWTCFAFLVSTTGPLEIFLKLGTCNKLRQIAGFGLFGALCAYGPDKLQC